MKKTLKQQNEEMAKYIKQLDAQLNDSIKSDRNGNIISIGFAAIILVLAIIATVQNSEISELKRSIRFKDRYIEYLEHKVFSKAYDESFTERCRRLAEESGKGFSVVTEYITQKKACNYGQAFLYSKREIEDAMKHYQLGNKENKK